jgi:phage gp29-like protein
VQNATLALPSGWDAEFLSAQQTGATFEQFEQAIIKRIQKLILGQTLTSDVGSSGSFAAAKVHQSVLDDRKRADIRLVTKTVQTLVNALHTLNGFTGEPSTFVMEDNTGLEIERADRDSKLVQSGVLTLTPDYLLRVYDYEDGDFEIPAVAAPPKPQTVGTKPANFSASVPPPTKFTPQQQEIETLADAVLENLGSPIPESAIFNAIKAASDYEDLTNRLAVLFAETDTSEFRQVLERATFAADCLGFANVK